MALHLRTVSENILLRSTLYPVVVEIAERLKSHLCNIRILLKYEPRFEKTGLRGFQPCPTQTGLYNQRRWL